jgi:hypothetical protein
MRGVSRYAAMNADLALNADVVRGGRVSAGDTVKLVREALSF